MRAVLLAVLVCGCGVDEPASSVDDTNEVSGAVSAPSGDEVVIEPNDGSGALLASIQSAKTSVHMTMYLLTSSAIEKALIAQHAAGRDVRVVLNARFSFGANANQKAFDALTAAGVNVHWAPSNFTYTHEKCVLIDGALAWIMTMNATASSVTANREYLAVDTASADVAEAESVFEADFANQAIVPQGSLLVSPVNARPGLLALIASAVKSIDIEVEELSETQIVQALALAADRGVRVDVVLANTTLTASQQQAVTTLRAHHGHVVSLAKPYIHAKTLVVDVTRAYVGSMNFSATSLLSNRELGVILDAPAEVSRIAATAQADFAAGTAL